MISEETGLNDALSDIGIETVETDLGEFIVQTSNLQIATHVGEFLSREIMLCE